MIICDKFNFSNFVFIFANRLPFMSSTNGAEEIDDVTPGLQPHESHQSELKKRLDMEIKLIKAEEKIKILEKKYNVMDEKNKQLKTEIARLKQDERNYKNKLFSKLSVIFFVESDFIEFRLNF